MQNQYYFWIVKNYEQRQPDRFDFFQHASAAACSRFPDVDNDLQTMRRRLSCSKTVREDHVTPRQPIKLPVRIRKPHVSPGQRFFQKMTTSHLKIHFMNNPISSLFYPFRLCFFVFFFIPLERTSKRDDVIYKRTNIAIFSSWITAYNNYVLEFRQMDL